MTDDAVKAYNKLCIGRFPEGFQAKMNRKHSRIEKRIFIITCIFLVAVNGILGTLMIMQLRDTLKTQIRERMLDVSESAADLMNGDELEKLRAEDRGTEPYEKAMSTLKVFQDNVKLAYIYGIRDMGDGTFTFTIDPTVEDPGEFGEPVQYTDALYKASKGEAAVDDVSYEDKWGRFYSSYSPVFNSKGEVAGIIAVDFDAEWYENEMTRYMAIVFVVCMVSLLAGALIVFIVTGNIRESFRNLTSEMNRLTDDMSELAHELSRASGKPDRIHEQLRVKSEAGSSGDIIDEIGDMIHYIREEMREYIDDAHALAYRDALTGVGNRNAYLEKIRDLNRKIDDFSADFAMAVFDLNGLKKANDNLGHEYGDELISNAARVLSEVFGEDRVFRIGGDEFIALEEGFSMEEMEERFAELDKKIEEINADCKENEMPLSISKGAAKYKEEDGSLKNLFRRADEAMYRDKAGFYEKRGESRA